MITNEEFTAEKEAAALYLLDQTLGYTYQASLRAVAILGVADHLKDRPKTAQELGVDSQYLYRTMRLLATRDIFREVEDKRFSLSPAAEFLCISPYSLRSAVLMLTDETFWNSLGNIVESVRGHAIFKKLYGMSFYEYWSQPQTRSPEYDFHSGMSSMSEIENLSLMRSYHFPDHVIIADIAGGLGGLLLKVLQTNPTLYGILFDQAPRSGKTSS